MPPSPISRESVRALVQNLISNSKDAPPKLQQQIAVEIEKEAHATKNQNKQQQFSSPQSNSSSCSYPYACPTSSFSSSERDQIHLMVRRMLKVIRRDHEERGVYRCCVGENFMFGFGELDVHFSYFFCLSSLMQT